MARKNTTHTKSIKLSEVTEQWFLLDATNQRIGRISSLIAELLLGKQNPKLAAATNLNPMVKVVVINCEKLFIPANKLEDKLYSSYSGYPDGLKQDPLKLVLEKHPERIIENAVSGMLPKNRRGEAIKKNLYVYVGTEHKHEAQKPQVVNLNK